MNNVENSLIELKSKLDQLPLIEEFLRLKEVMENDEELKTMRQEIARLKAENKSEEHDVLLEIYNSNPIIVNYNLLREDVKNLLGEIKNILEG